MIRLLIYTRETIELDTYGDENIAITYNIINFLNNYMIYSQMYHNLIH